MAKGRSSLGAADALLTTGFPSESTSRSYFGAFYAAEAALLLLGITRNKHSGVISAFNKHVIKEGGLGQDHGKALRTLFDARNRADYGPGEVTPDEAQDFRDRAGALVDAVDVWMEGHARS